MKISVVDFLNAYKARFDVCASTIMFEFIAPNGDTGVGYLNQEVGDVEEAKTWLVTDVYVEFNGFRFQVVYNSEDDLLFSVVTMILSEDVKQGYISEEGWAKRMQDFLDNYVVNKWHIGF